MTQDMGGADIQLTAARFGADGECWTIMDAGGGHLIWATMPDFTPNIAARFDYDFLIANEDYSNTLCLSRVNLQIKTPAISDGRCNLNPTN
jgi:hypothetical protein